MSTLTSALSSYLTGKGTASFLPRLAFAKLTSVQIKKYFDMHQSYVRSLRPIKLSPAIANIDVLRREFFPDGTFLDRTPRAWATSLTLDDGVTPARCDVTNGSTDFQTYLLVPAPHLAAIQGAARDYRFRLNTLGERETRFRDSLPAAPPSEILIDLSTQENLSFLESLSVDDFWCKVPASARDRSDSTKPATLTRIKSRGSVSGKGPENDLSPSSQTPIQGSASSAPKTGTQTKPMADTRPASRNPQSDDVSIRSVGSSSLAGTVMSRLEEMDKDLKAQKLDFEKFVAQTNARFDQDDIRIDGIITQSMAKHHLAFMTAMQTQFEGMMAQLMASLHPTIASSPPACRPHSSTYESTQASFPPSVSASLPINGSPPYSTALVRHYGLRSSMSVASGSSGSSSSLVKPPQPKKTKKSRSTISTDMEHLSIDTSNGSDSEFSDLGEVLYFGQSHALASLSPTNNAPNSSMQCESLPEFTTKDAHPDPNAQYQSPSASDGGAPE